ncbi:MAG: entry exclusion lipoprotein TrbK [Nitrosospira sp.]
MKKERSAALYVVTTLMLVMLAGCNNDIEKIERKVKLINPTCEDLGKITDNAEHAALLAKCPGYLPGGTKKSPPRTW